MNVIKIKNIDNANEHVSNIFIMNLYDKIKNHITNKNDSLLEGKIECNNTYQSVINYLTNLYNRLYITVSRDLYIEFEDELCKEYIANKLGDNIGILESDVNYLTKYNLHNVLSIPSGVTKFNELKYFTAYTRLEGLNNEDCSVFKICDTLQEINLRNVTYISNVVFEDLQNLKTLNESYNVNYIGTKAFKNTALESINFPNITNSGWGVFMECTHLKTAIFDGNIERLNDQLFDGCSELISLSGCSNVNYIGKTVFRNCINLETLNINYENIKTIQEGAFRNCKKLSFNNVDLTNVTTFSYYAFEGCESLTSITFGLDDPITFGSGMFKNCKNLTQCVIPNNVSTQVGSLSNMFYGCTSLTSITLPSNQISITLPQSFAENCSALTTIVNSQNIIKLDLYALRNCTSLVNIDLSNANIIMGHSIRGCTGLKSVDLSNVQTINSCAFYDCTGLEQLGNLNKLTVLGEQAFWNVGNSNNPIGKIEAHIIESIDQQAFRNSLGFTEFEFQNLLTIGWGAFQGCSNLTKVTGLDNVLSIGTNIFNGCSKLENISMNSLLQLSAQAFYNCTLLKTASFSNCVNATSEKIFYGCTNLETLYLPKATEFNRGDVFNYCNKLKTIDISSCTTISAYTFRNLLSLENITAPLLENGYKYMFSGCTALKTISLPKMTVYPEQAFRDDTELTTVTLAANATTIGKSCFNNCRKLANIDLSNITTINSWAFENCTSLRSIDLSSCSSLEEGAFNGCTGLITDVVLPPTITVINKNIFNNCPNILSVTIQSTSVLDYASSAFWGGNYPIYVPDNLVADYKANSTWRELTSRIFSINDKPST